VSLDRQEIARLLAAEIISEATAGVPSPDVERQFAEAALMIARDIVAYGTSYLLIHGDAAIMCFTCGRVSYHPQDVANRYCGCCHKFHFSGAES
jgi:hypothetical protein